MASTDYVASCAVENVDAVTGQCTSIQWVPKDVGGFPPLSAAEGVAISGAIGMCWAVGFLVRTLRQTARG